MICAAVEGVGRMGDLSPRNSQQRHRERAGKDAYRRFAIAMREFRDAVAEMAETSGPDLKRSPGGFAGDPDLKAQRHQKIITKLRANGYRPLSEIVEEV